MPTVTAPTERLSAAHLTSRPARALRLPLRTAGGA